MATSVFLSVLVPPVGLYWIVVEIIVLVGRIHSDVRRGQGN